MFELINEVERYPEFVPGCAAAQVLSRTPSEIQARLTVGRGPLRTAFTTRNHLTPDRQVRMELVEGPFRSLQGLWTLCARDQAGYRRGGGLSCFAGRWTSNPGVGLAGLAIGPLMEQTVNSLVDAFVSRATRSRTSYLSGSGLVALAFGGIRSCGCIRNQRVRQGRRGRTCIHRGALGSVQRFHGQIAGGFSGSGGLST